MQGQRQARPSSQRPHRAPRPSFIAAVRYPDGRRDLFIVRNADDLDDARALVRSEVGDLRALVIAPYHGR